MEFFEDFLRYFAPGLYEQVDLKAGIDFLEQALTALFPREKGGNKYTDKLAKMNTYKILEQGEPSLLTSDNPFALAILAGLMEYGEQNGGGAAHQSFRLRLTGQPRLYG